MSYKFFFLFVTAVVLFRVNGEETSKGKVLIFGGNGFIGSHIADQFYNEGYEIITVNRNNTYFADYEPDYQPIPVKSFKCNRLYITMDCDHFVDYVRNNEFELVVDLSASSTRIMGETISFLDGKTKVFMFPSTDKIYDLLTPPELKKQRKPKRKTGFKEDEVKGKTRLIEPDDTFQHLKRNLELALLKQRESLGFPYVIFRLGDVFGPRSSNSRIFRYMIWLEMAPLINKPVTIPEDFERTPLSLVYVEDVARAMSYTRQNPTLWDNIYNLMYEPSRQLNLEALLNKVAAIMGVKPLVEVIDQATWMYPTLTTGYPNASKIHATGYIETPLDEALEKTVNYFQNLNSTEKFKPYFQNIANNMIRGIFSNSEYKAATYFSDRYGLNMRKFLKWYKEKEEL